MSADTSRPAGTGVSERLADDRRGHCSSDSRPYECVIVGGGLHGIHVAARLLEETEIEHRQLRIVDFNRELAVNFRKKATQCGMMSMRSSYLDHVGVHPFELEMFAAQQNRTDELFETYDYPHRPSLSLFLDHVDYVIDTYDLDDLHIRARVTGLNETEDGVAIETDDGIINAYRCVLAIGHGNRYTRPSWTAALDESTVDHVWDTSFGLDDYGQTIVIGGGVTAAQTALALSDRGNDVTLLTRSGLTERTIEGDQKWQRWDHVRSELHSLPPGTRARLHRVREARYQGTVPSYLMRDVQAAVADNDISVVEGTVAQVTNGRESDPRLALTDGRSIQADHVALATGFESPFEHPFVERIASGLELVRGYAGMPVLNDQTLAWNRRDGTPSSVYVVGALATGSVGPFAGNIVGARMAASQLVGSLSFDGVRRSLAPVGQSVSP